MGSQASGEGGIRTPGGCYTTPVFKTGKLIPESTNTQEVTETANSVLPSGLPESLNNDTDFVRLVDCWPSLPAYIRQTILTLAKSVSSE